MELLTHALDWLVGLLREQPVLLLFSLLALGYVIGGISIRGFTLGPVAGVLFAGIFFGHEGLRITPGAQAVGFALFIFSVGYQAGPRFFSALKADGFKYFVLSLVVAVSGCRHLRSLLSLVIIITISGISIAISGCLFHCLWLLMSAVIAVAITVSGRHRFQSLPLLVVAVVGCCRCQ